MTVDNRNEIEIAKGWQTTGDLARSVIRQQDDPLMPENLIRDARNILIHEKKARKSSVSNDQS
jgi:hypothetical protein